MNAVLHAVDFGPEDNDDAVVSLASFKTPLDIAVQKVIRIGVYDMRYIPATAET
jgi:hypothetical protein